MVRRFFRALGVALALVILFAANSCSAQQAPLGNMPPDDWGGRHAHVGYSATMGFVLPQFIEHKGAAWAACFSVGAWKEWKDYRKDTPGYRHGLFSRHDLQMDALGCSLGVLGAWGLRLASGPSGGARLIYTWELR